VTEGEGKRDFWAPLKFQCLREDFTVAAERHTLLYWWGQICTDPCTIHVPPKSFSKSTSGAQTCHWLSCISVQFTSAWRRANTAQLKKCPFTINRKQKQINVLWGECFSRRSSHHDL